jgi:NAD(P)-dependent dehydrogenase (short-subunit alcohol dehydrogenase family)
MKKTILITGSTDGIGKLTALKLASEGNQVYLHGRNTDKLEKVISEMKAASNNPNIKGFVADFSDMDAVKKMAAAVSKEVSTLDVLINNAGVYKSPVSKTNDNFDIRFAVNYFAPFILTERLLPLIKKGNTPRIINLSSAAQAPVSMEALEGKTTLNEMEAYSQSKLALTMWSFYLAEKEPTIITISVNPGSLLNTNMVKKGWGFHRSSADKGRDILYNLAVVQKYENASGKYFNNDIGTFGAVHPAGNSKETINELISKTNELLK